MKMAAVSSTAGSRAGSPLHLKEIVDLEGVGQGQPERLWTETPPRWPSQPQSPSQRQQQPQSQPQSPRHDWQEQQESGADHVWDEVRSALRESLRDLCQHLIDHFESLELRLVGRLKEDGGGGGGGGGCRDCRASGGHSLAALAPSLSDAATAPKLVKEVGKDDGGGGCGGCRAGAGLSFAAPAPCLSRGATAPRVVEAIGEDAGGGCSGGLQHCPSARSAMFSHASTVPAELFRNAESRITTHEIPEVKVRRGSDASTINDKLDSEGSGCELCAVVPSETARPPAESPMSTQGSRRQGFFNVMQLPGAIAPEAMGMRPTPTSRPAFLPKVANHVEEEGESSGSGSASDSDQPSGASRGRGCRSLGSFTHSKIFRIFTSLVIVLNAVFIGLQTEYMLTPPPREHGDTWRWIERSFTIFFIAELLLRIAADRTRFLVGRERGWNIFDSLLVLQTIFDWANDENAGPSVFEDVPTLGVTRILRIFRFVKILRLVRVLKAFHSFRVMVYSILHSMLSLLWVLSLLFFVIYSFTIFFLLGVADYIEAHPHSRGRAGDQLIAHYGSLHNALFSLFLAISGGRDWVELIMPLSALHWGYSLGFLLYVFFTLFGVLNVVTSTFVDSAYQVSMKDKDIMIQHEAANEKRYTHNMKTFFHEADKDRSGLLSWKEFDDHLKDPDVKAYFTALELDVSQARALFQLLDVDDTNEIGIDEFVEGCTQLKGNAKSIDVHMILLENEKLINKLTSFMVFSQGQFASIRAALNLPQVEGTPHARNSSRVSVRRDMLIDRVRSRTSGRL